MGHTASDALDELERLLAGRDHSDPAELFGDIPDDLWLWMNTEGRVASPVLETLLPGLPDARTQRHWTGKDGIETLTEGFVIYRTLRDLYTSRFGNLREAGPVLDFGCGWGRVIRYFLKDVDAGSLLGTDYDDTLVQFCIASNPWCQFTRNGAAPPLPYDDHSVAFVYAYSVFSHFSEPMHKQWLDEFKRVVRPGGAIALTVRQRRFIEHRQRLRAEAKATFVQRQTFEQADAALARYDAGEYCFAPYEASDPDAWWGEACIPRSYIEEHWSEQFEVVDFIDGRELKQHVVLLRA